MNPSHLFHRSTGSVGPLEFARAQTSRLVHALQPAPLVRFDSGGGEHPEATRHAGHDVAEDKAEFWAHRAGVNALAVDRFEGRYMLSGGADSSIYLWDLEMSRDASNSDTYGPVGAVSKGQSTHRFGITHLSFYPFDSLAFLSSSYDHTLKIYSSETLEPSASFDLTSVVYSHALSPVASHLLVACATQHPTVRLVDLRSGASTHALAGHGGAVLSVAWSPTEEHVLASAGTDGTVRLWDVRRSAGGLGVFDMEDSVGVVGCDGLGTGARRGDRGKAHSGAVNGVVWTDDGEHVVTTGHDERVRVWSVATGANTLTSFGPIVKNAHLSALLPLIAPSHLTELGKPVMFYPNEREIVVFDLFEGTLLKRLKAPGSTVSSIRSKRGQRNVKNRVTSLAWRAGSVEMFSAHSDGLIRTWMPRTREDDELDAAERRETEAEDSEYESRKRQRQVLDDVYQDLTRQKITFG